MGRISDIDLYPFDTAITPNDYIIGTDGDNLNATRNYKVSTMLGYLGNMFNLQSQDLYYTYNAVASGSVGVGEISSNNYLDSTIAMSGITNLYVSKLTALGALVDTYINAIATDNLTVIVMDLSAPQNYAIFNLTGSSDVDANTIDLAGTVSDSNGILVSGRSIGLKLTAGGGVTGNFVTIDTVQTITGQKTFSATRTDINGELIAGDVIKMSAASTATTGGVGTGIFRYVGSSLYAFHKDNSFTIGEFNFAALTANRTYDLPDITGELYVVPTGDTSFFIAQGAGDSDDTTNNNNTGVGYFALNDVITGSNNTALGANAARNLLGSQNVAIGSDVLFTATTASSNVAIGFQALQLLTTAGSNIAIGVDTLREITTGSNNIAIGSNTGDSDGATPFQTNQYGVLIGRNIKFSANATNQEIVIGGQGALVGKGSNTALIGNTSLTDFYFGYLRSDISNLTVERTATWQDSSGTVAWTSDISTQVKTSTISDSGNALNTVSELLTLTIPANTMEDGDIITFEAYFTIDTGVATDQIGIIIDGGSIQGITNTGGSVGDVHMTGHATRNGGNIDFAFTVIYDTSSTLTNARYTKAGVTFSTDTTFSIAGGGTTIAANAVVLKHGFIKLN